MLTILFSILLALLSAGLFLLANSYVLWYLDNIWVGNYRIIVLLLRMTLYLFRHLRSSFSFRHNENNRRKFVYYSAYGWGFPLAWILFTLYAEKFKPFPHEWNPTVGVNVCFLDGMHLILFPLQHNANINYHFPRGRSFKLEESFVVLSTTCRTTYCNKLCSVRDNRFPLQSFEEWNPPNAKYNGRIMCNNETPEIFHVESIVRIKSIFFWKILTQPTSHIADL